MLNFYPVLIRCFLFQAKKTFDTDQDEDQYRDLLLLIQLLKHILAKDFTFGFPVTEGKSIWTDWKHLFQFLKNGRCKR